MDDLGRNKSPQQFYSFIASKYLDLVCVKNENKKYM